MKRWSPLCFLKETTPRLASSATILFLFRLSTATNQLLNSIGSNYFLTFPSNRTNTVPTKSWTNILCLLWYLFCFCQCVGTLCATHPSFHISVVISVFVVLQCFVSVLLDFYCVVHWNVVCAFWRIETLGISRYLLLFVRRWLHWETSSHHGSPSRTKKTSVTP